MTPAEWGEIVGKLLEAVPAAALAVLFSAFAVVLLWILLSYIRERDKTTAEQRAAEQKAAIEERAARDREWRLFLSESQERSVSGQRDLASRLGDEMKGMAVAVNSVATLMANHDTATRLAQQKVDAQLDTLQSRRYQSQPSGD